MGAQTSSTLPRRRTVVGNKCRINDLPDEALLLIFSYVTKPTKLQKTLSRVCLRWRRLSKDASLYRRLVFDADDPITSTATVTIRTAPWLTCLELNSRKDTDLILCHIKNHCPLLEKLELSRCQGSSASRHVSSKHLRQVMATCTKLLSLSLVRTIFNDPAVYRDIGSSLTSLTAINFGDVPKQVAVEALMAVVNNCVEVEEIQMFSDGITQEIIHILCGKFKSSLKFLKLKNRSAWTDATLASLATCEKIENLSLCKGTGIITDNSLMLTCLLMPNIKQLELYMFDTNKPSFWLQLLSLPNMINLKCLKLSCRYVRDYVLTAVSLLPNIEVLALHRRGLTIKGLLSIAELPKLVKLYVTAEVRVTADEWIEFLSKPSLRNMTHMHLMHCSKLDVKAARVIFQDWRRLEGLILNGRRII